MKKPKFISSLESWSTGNKSLFAKVGFVALGLISTLWFLIRVIPKPSRAAYPCMKASAPLASSFIAYLLGITTVSFALKKAKDNFRQSKQYVALGMVFIGLIAGGWAVYHVNNSVKATELASIQAGNEPIGTGKGIFPGRVVWVYNPDATNENCTNEEGDYCSSDDNADQTIISTMVSDGLKSMAGAASDAAAWDSVFRYYNRNHGKGNVGYSAGEKIVIKVNFNGIYNSYTSTPPKNINTSPQVCYAILYQLVNKAGVAQANISIGDPNCPMTDVVYDKCSAAFPDVTYWGTGTGRTSAEQSTSKVFFGSDDTYSDYLPQAYVDADYMINIPVFKKHHRAGISLGCKNHFGSIGAYSGGAGHLHYSLPCPNATGVADNGNYGAYRCFVDIMGHKDLGGKTILYLVDGIWGSVNWGHPPVKWRMAPFNDDWPSSLFLSQDPVAIESVGYDFLYQEFDETHPTEGEFVGDDKGPFPRFAGTDDYLHQAASKSNWASGITYDPEDDGTELASSLGTHEHWNNATDKKYSRNLNPTTGTGIELYLSGNSSPVNQSFTDNTIKIYPNPVTETLNVALNTATTGTIFINIMNLEGKEVFNAMYNASNSRFRQSIPVNKLAEGMYVVSLKTNDKVYSKAFVKK